MPAPRTLGVGQTKENIIGAFPIPLKGMIRNQPESVIPKDALWSGRNLHLFQGEVRQRASWTGIRNTTVAAPAQAGHLNGLFTGRRAGTINRFLFAGGTVGAVILQDAVSALGAAGWRTIASWGATRARTQLVRFAELAYGTPLLTRIAMCNGIDTPRVFTLAAASADFVLSTALTGADPWKDVTMTSDRIVGITDTEVSWGETLRTDLWPALNHKSLAETLDYCIAIRPLIGLHVAIWKEKSIWLGQARGGSSASYFTWKLMKSVDGPVSPAALVSDLKGGWYWLTRHGRVVRMRENFQIDYPCDQIWPVVRDDTGRAPQGMSRIESEYRLAHGMYDAVNDEVHFFYPAAQQTTVRVDVGIIICKASEPQPVAFLADFPGILSERTNVSSLLDITASGTISETAFTSGLPAQQYLEDPVVVYQLFTDYASAATPGVSPLAAPTGLAALVEDTCTPGPLTWPATQAPPPADPLPYTYGARVSVLVPWNSDVLLGRLDPAETVSESVASDETTFEITRRDEEVTFGWRSAFDVETFLGHTSLNPMWRYDPLYLYYLYITSVPGQYTDSANVRRIGPIDTRGSIFSHGPVVTSTDAGWALGRGISNNLPILNPTAALIPWYRTDPNLFRPHSPNPFVTVTGCTRTWNALTGPSHTYGVRVTAFNATDESLPSAEVTFVITPGDRATLTWNQVVGPPAATGYYIYLTETPGDYTHAKRGRVLSTDLAPPPYGLGTLILDGDGDPLLPSGPPPGGGVGHLRLAVELEDGGDDKFDIEIQTGLHAAPGGDTYRLEAIEPFLRRSPSSIAQDRMPGRSIIMVDALASDILDEEGGKTSIITTQVPSLNDGSQPVKAVVNGDIQGRWFGLRIRALNTDAHVRYLGAILRGRRVT